ncbi:putative MFS family arabinose efflux permease [Cellulomonas sp. URHB0016]
MATSARLLRTPSAPSYFLGYLLFQAGNFTAFSFIGTWLTQGFGLSVTAVATAIVPLGAASACASFFGGGIAGRLGPVRSRRAAMGALMALYAVLPFAPDLGVALALLCSTSLVGGFVFPVLMATMQGLTTTARGTVSALTSSTMYLGTTVGGVIGGVLITRYPGFHGIASAVIVLLALSLASYVHADRTQARHQRAADETARTGAQESGASQRG